MLKNLISDLEQYASIGIFGFGMEGKSFYNFAQKYLPNTELVIIDKNHPSCDENYLDKLDEVELIVKSPGISLYNLGIDYKSYKFSSTTELLLKHFKNQIIGVTGTKGKSTLVTLIDSLLKNAGKKSVLCGNIGTPAFDILENLDDETTIVMELSSHQLYHVNYSVHIAILTNLFEEHLDYYKDVDEYYSAKFNIFLHQKKNDIFIYNLPQKLTRGYNVHENELKYNVDFNLQNGFIHKSTLQILEKLKEILALDDAVYLRTIQEFKTLPHRLEFVKNIKGVSYINDSISTIPQATIEAVKILKNVDTLILGGNDRGVHYDVLIDFLQKSDIDNIILFSDTGKKIYDALHVKEKQKGLFIQNNLQESVKKAYNISRSIVLFSPAASSFNEYKNFIERGDEFKSLVNQLKG
ncbi:Mur ligase family protein [Sulfurimonas autotrophica]|uniref:UDP-N-acetylmuramoylalanine--D-glutamate ligase n=1 Tax=Sulfurimonas autotrophica (strain ATCC BAA-671 / DSM 16294 / JCM 11897 / OK10) TaxID=563040 RepID=E0UPR4_SULAO|nr:Mur ligase family protein [Sulfurimonas autotrophica]ADN08656.1 UDP-N-acetylmuramoylalanine/D-glutamate ligase [Sulfurimonas autotrophica DSM 16294]